MLPARKKIKAERDAASASSRFTVCRSWTTANVDDQRVGVARGQSMMIDAQSRLANRTAPSGWW
jgi:hypothetical protein